MREDFAHVHTLAGFEPMAEAALRRASAAGADAAPLRRALEAIHGFDGAPPPERRARLTSLLVALAELIELPAPLVAIAGANRPRPTDAAGATGAGAPATALPASAPAGEDAGPAASAIETATKGTATPRAKAARRTAAATDAADDAAPPSPRKRARRSAKADDASAREDEAEYAAAPPRLGRLADPLSFIVSVRGRLAAELKKRGLTRVGDVLDYLPRTYEDRRRTLRIGEWPPGTRGVALARVDALSEPTAGGRRMLKVHLSDATGRLEATFFNFQPWMRKRFTVGETYLVSGELSLFGGRREIAHPEIEPAREAQADLASFHRIVPIYPGFERGEQRAFRALALKVVERYAPGIADHLPAELVRRLGLVPLAQAMREVHFPTGPDFDPLLDQRVPAQRRLAFDELFLLQLGLALRRARVKRAEGIRFDVSPELLDRARGALPFAPTGAQRRALDEIARDMGRAEPMNRLLQGDVGSGKTAVATVAALLAIENGYQAALMAPTEILAEQHHRTLSRLLEPLGHRVALLTATTARKRSDATKDAVARGEAQIAVGTHALLTPDVAFARLGLVIIDEQHRFGVLQRAELMGKGTRPDVLVMTATPIPRTLAMALYGDLDVSVLDELPPGRTPITTRVFFQSQRERAYAAIERELEAGHQAFVVYPLVEESEKSDLQSAVEGAAALAARFPRWRVGLVHGRMKSPEKDEVMRAFRDGQYQILVATTVVEVGVDVPNASVMLVESAERFGLSQLHQLRGRVGRGAARSYCFLVASGPGSEVARQRLGIMEQTTDGFRIAEADLELRGPGEFIGTRQSGVPSLGLANLARDADLLALAQREAQLLAERDPLLAGPDHARLKEALLQRWQGKLGLAEVS